MYQLVGLNDNTKNTSDSIFSLQAFRYNARNSLTGTERELATMNENEIKMMIEQAISCQSIEVSGDGRHFEALIVSEDFIGKRAVARQQMVYATVQDHISSGELHALSLKTMTPEEAAAA